MSKLHQNPSSGSGVVPCRRTDGRTDGPTDGRTDRQTDMTELIVAFRNFANVPKTSVPTSQETLQVVLQRSAGFAV